MYKLVTRHQRLNRDAQPLPDALQEIPFATRGEAVAALFAAGKKLSSRTGWLIAADEDAVAAGLSPYEGYLLDPPRFMVVNGRGTGAVTLGVEEFTPDNVLANVPSGCYVASSHSAVWQVKSRKQHKVLLVSDASLRDFIVAATFPVIGSPRYVVNVPPGVIEEISRDPRGCTARFSAITQRCSTCWRRLRQPEMTCPVHGSPSDPTTSEESLARRATELGLELKITSRGDDDA
jgi:hypothetical protein